jgi:hypothetical protein
MQGHASRPALERLYHQTCVVMAELAALHHPAVAALEVRQLVLGRGPPLPLLAQPARTLAAAAAGGGGASSSGVDTIDLMES